MITSKFDFNRLVHLLCRSENDPEVRKFFGQQMSNIKRDEYYGSLEFKPEGVGVVFQEAPWVVSAARITDPKELYLAAFHLYRGGYEGFAEYPGQLPNGVAFGDPEAEVLRKMGQPVVRGGTGIRPVLKRPIPRWFYYALGGAILHFQLDANGRVEMITLRTPEVRQS